MSDVKKVWNSSGDVLYLSSPSKEFEKLENIIYTVGVDQFQRFYLAPKASSFTFNHKIYGLEDAFINHVVRTYENTTGNLGILLSGMKGSGKSVTSKQICQKLGNPVILVDANIEGVGVFLNSISQDITIFIDEYEKTFKESAEMLPIMDGSLNSAHRRVFIFTTNELYIEKNLLERPSRIRYLKKFTNLNPEVIEEIIDDMLIHKQFSKDCLNFISMLETITVDVVKTIIEEINIHNISPAGLESFMNVKKKGGKYDLYLIEGGNQTKIGTSIQLNPSPEFNDRMCNDFDLYVNGTGIGVICDVIDHNTIMVKPYDFSDGENIKFSAPIRLMAVESDVINSVFAYNSNYGSEYSNKAFVSDYLGEILKKIEG